MSQPAGEKNQAPKNKNQIKTGKREERKESNNSPPTFNFSYLYFFWILGFGIWNFFL
jgi:hypothetical protein